jgi:hypothetical protein
VFVQDRLVEGLAPIRVRIDNDDVEHPFAAHAGPLERRLD